MDDILKLAAAYIRVSTDDQLELSPDSQLVEIKKYAAANGYAVPPEYVFVDEAVSGRQTKKREAFMRMIGTAKKKPKPFDAIILWKFSRFARNREDSIVYKGMLRKQCGIDVLSIKEPIGNDKTSIIMEAVIEAMDEYYSINLAEDVIRGMTEKARRGELQTYACFGYHIENNTLIPSDQDADIVKQIFAKFISGDGYFPIARWLNESGVRTRFGNPFENRTVEYIIRNPAYIGMLRWTPTGRTRRVFDNPDTLVTQGKHQPLIDMATWEAAQRRVAEIKAQHAVKGRPDTEHKHWMSGLIKCSECGRSLTASGRDRAWMCIGYTHGQCKYTQRIAEERLSQSIINQMLKDADDSHGIKFSVVFTSPQKDDADILQGQYDRAMARIERLRLAFLDGAESVEDYKTTKEALEANARSILDQISKASAKVPPKLINNKLSRQLRDAVSVLQDPDSTMQQKHLAAHDVIDHAVWSRDENSLTLFYRIFL